VPPLQREDDPAGWHDLEVHTGISMRRARRMDIWLEETWNIDAGFQDSASLPDGSRVAVHEYRVNVAVDRGSMRLLSIHADPRVLPYSECPTAAPNVQRLLGTHLADIRTTVLNELPGTLGCTHLNDALRALADTPTLIRHLERTIPIQAYE
jgi:hypothetical protein